MKVWSSEMGKENKTGSNTCRSLLVLYYCMATSGKNEHRHKLFVTRAKGHDIDVITEWLYAKKDYDLLCVCVCV